MPISFCKFLPSDIITEKSKVRNNSKTDLQDDASKKKFMNAIPPTTIYKSIPQDTKSVQSKPPVLSSEYNIFQIDAKIKDSLKGKMDDISKYISNLNIIKWINQHSPDSVDKVLSKHDIHLLRRTILDIEYETEYGYYIYQTSDLLDEYRRLISQNQTRSFVRSTTTKDTNIHNKTHIIQNYLRIARKYIDIGMMYHKTSKMVCLCGSTEFKLEDDNLYTCMATSCGIQLELLDDSPSFKDTDRINMCSKYVYSLKGHFVDAISRFQGTQNTTINESVYETLKREIKLHNIKMENVTRDHVYMFLSENKLTKHNEDVALIHSVLTGHTLPNITEYIPDLMDLFDQEEMAYQEVKDPSRVNSLNVNYKLCKLLQKLGYQTDKNDFFFLKTATALQEHENIWEQICNKLGWEFIKTV